MDGLQHATVGGCVKRFLTCFESVAPLGDHETAFEALSPPNARFGLSTKLGADLIERLY